MRVCFYTLGCKVNQNETGALAQLFEQNGFTVVEEKDGADVYVVNSCTVTNFGDQKSRKWLRRAKRENPGAVTVLTGCYPQAFPEEAAKIEEADVVTADVDLTTVKHAGRPLFTAPVNVTAKAVNRAGVVTLDCTYRFTLHVLCDRCLAPLELPVDRTVSHTVVREVNGEDDETFLVAENGCVELEELATNDILPELPQRCLCREDCRGLCPTCGKNLNKGPCGCREDSGDPRMDVLRRLLEN